MRMSQYCLPERLTSSEDSKPKDNEDEDDKEFEGGHNIHRHTSNCLRYYLIRDSGVVYRFSADFEGRCRV